MICAANPLAGTSGLATFHFEFPVLCCVQQHKSFIAVYVSSSEIPKMLFTVIMSLGRQYIRISAVPTWGQILCQYLSPFVEIPLFRMNIEPRKVASKTSDKLLVALKTFLFQLDFPTDLYSGIPIALHALHILWGNSTLKLYIVCLSGRQARPVQLDPKPYGNQGCRSRHGETLTHRSNYITGRVYSRTRPKGQPTIPYCLPKVQVHHMVVPLKLILSGYKGV